MFQEPRLLPWLDVLENISIPLERAFGKEKAKARASDFLSLVSLEEKEKVFPLELSGGQAQRISMARAFAWSAPVLLMDEPFQSLDIPLRKNLMDLTLSLLGKEKRLLIMVTHDPREAVYLGGRVIVFGKSGEGIVFDRVVDYQGGKRIYGSPGGAELEREIINSLFNLESVVVP
jgi:ABC-type nitrate/sulfonate/bicarbonate transport system ATPase subunit